jgi:aminoglycoside/choline kinase family phosphotransferase
MTPARLAALETFAVAHLGPLNAPVTAASADASFRSYWRVRWGGETFIVMDAPPEKEDLGPFVDIAQRLRAARLNAPAVLAEDRAQGFLLLSDLGTRTLLPELDDGSVDTLYADALNALARMQTDVDANRLPAYEEARLRNEMGLFPTWFLERHLGHVASSFEAALIERCMALLVTSAVEQPQVFVHRDYHSRNLMIVPGANLGIIDFQDAVRGPITYDLASLLKDCYIRWPAERVQTWAEDYRQRMQAAGLVDVDAERWQRWFDLIGLQRHLKVLGIFARLNYRDGKAGYLNDLPLVLEYTLEACARYPELAEFGEWLAGITEGVDLTAPRPAERT